MFLQLQDCVSIIPILTNSCQRKVGIYLVLSLATWRIDQILFCYFIILNSSKIFMDQIVLIVHVKYGKTNSKRSICCYGDCGKIHDFWISAPHHLCINICCLLCNKGGKWTSDIYQRVIM